MGKKIETDIQIRFADVDGLGHVNNVNLQHYFDQGKMEFYSATLGRKVEPSRESLILVSTHTDYLAQTRLYDRIYVETAVEKIGNKSITFFQRLISRESGEVRAECRTVAVAFDFISQKSFELKPEWVSAFSEYML